MTRSGSLAFYSAAIVIGCFFMVTFALFPLLYLQGWSGLRFVPVREFLLFYAMGLTLGGWWTALVFAFVLRKAMSVLHWAVGWRWTAAGAPLSVLLVWSFGKLYHALGFPPKRPAWVDFFLRGPDMITSIRFWIGATALAGAATASILYFIHRAFEPRAQ